MVTLTEAYGPLDDKGIRLFNIGSSLWPTCTTGRPKTPIPLSDDHKGLINLFDTVLFAHQPTWDDIQQLMTVLFATEEQERIMQEARKNAPSDMGAPSIDQAIMETGFPLLDLTGTLIWQKVSGT